MASGKGLYSGSVAITSATDTAIITPDRADSTVHVIFLQFCTKTAGTAARAYASDGASGAVFYRAPLVTADQVAEFLPMAGIGNGRLYPGYALSPGNALNVNTTGSPAAAIEVVYIVEVK
jgi:hypothetical protein